MNTALSYIAGLIVLLLVAALAGPTFVDWNRFRGEFEQQAKKITGREVKIGGDIEFVVLPAPHLTLNNVSVANIGNSENPDFLRVGQVDVEVAFAPLFSGEISATSVKIARPQIHLEVNEDGTNNWRDLVSLSLLRKSGFFAAPSVSLQKVSFEEGTVTFHDRHAGRDWKVDHLNGDVTATSLVGPLRSEMSLSVNDIPLVLRVNLGDFSGDKAFKVTTEVQTLNVPAKLLFSGISTSFSSDARIDGTVSLELGSTKTAQGDTPRAPLRVEAGIVSTSDKATLRNLTVAMAGTTLKGDAEASWRGRPNVQIQLGGEALTLDPLSDQFGALIKGGGVPFSGIASLPVPTWLDAHANFKVDSLLSHDVLVKDAKLNLALQDGVLTVNTARGTVAGGSRFELNGALARGDVPTFNGKLTASSDNLGALALWLDAQRTDPVVTKAGEGGASSETAKPNPVTLKLQPAKTAAPMLASAARPFAIATDVALTAQKLSFTNLRAAYAKSAEPAQISGDLAFVAGDKGRVRLETNLVAQTFDADPLRALWSSDVNPRTFLQQHDFVMKAKADQLTIDGYKIAGLDLDASMTEGKLNIAKLYADSFAGAKLDFAGELNGVPQMDLASVSGSFNGNVTADKGGDFFSLFDLTAAGLNGPVDLGVDFSSGNASDSEVALDTLALKGTLGGSRVDAVLKRAAGSGKNAATLNLVANATNADARALLQQLGLQATDKLAGAGSASLQMSGPIDKPYDMNFRVNAGEGTFTAKGTLNDPLGARDFVGQSDISASGVSLILAALGSPDYLNEFVVAQASGPSFVASAKVQSNADALTLNSLEVVAGNLHLVGDVALASAKDGQKPQLTGKLESNFLDLTPVFGGDTKGVSPWSSDALNLSPMSRFGGNVDLKVAKLQIGTLHLEDANMHLALADDVLSVAPMTAKMADGAASITARIEGGDVGEPGIGLTYKVDGADFAKLSAQLVGTSFAAGNVSLDLQAEAQGRSWLGLVSSINGIGKITTKDARLAPLNVSGYSAALSGATSVDQLSALNATVLAAGETKVDGLDGDVTIKDGVARMTRETLAFDGGKGNLTAMLDVTRLAVDSEMRIGLTKPSDAPGFSDVAAGKIGAISRRIDNQALQQYASRRIIAKSISDAGLKDIPGELSDLMGLGTPTKGPSVAGIPLPMEKPQTHTSIQ